MATNTREQPTRRAPSVVTTAGKPPATVWAAAKSPAPNMAICSTDQQMVTENNDPAYEYSFLVHYTVNNILTVEWDDQWRFGTIVDEPFLGMIKHQKTQGSDFITLSEGTIDFVSDDPRVIEVYLGR